MAQSTYRALEGFFLRLIFACGTNTVSNNPGPATTSNGKHARFKLRRYFCSRSDPTSNGASNSLLLLCQRLAKDFFWTLLVRPVGLRRETMRNGPIQSELGRCVGLLSGICINEIQDPTQFFFFSSLNTSTNQPTK